MGNNEVAKLRARVHNSLLNARAFHRLVHSDDFAYACRYSTDGLDGILKSMNIDALRRWIKRTIPEELDHMSYRQLRDKAKLLNIYRWSRLSKDDLLEELKERERQLQSGQSATG